MSAFGTDATVSPELLKLAHSLDVPVERLSMLAGIPAEDVRTLRRQITDALFRADRAAFARVAALSKAVPAAVAAKLCELTLPPLMAARTTELLDPARAVDMVARMSDRYLADVAAAMDASRSPEVVGAIPGERAARVGQELARRGDWVVIGGFVSQVSDEALRASSAALSGEQLLHVSYVLDDPARLDDISAHLRDEQVDDLLRAAADVPAWAELTALVAALGDERRERMGRRLAASGTLHARFDEAAGAGLLDQGTLDRLRPA